ncbi:outer membrane protein assembly factor BamB family protein [Oerskovia enterophila]|uniref:outer membrane protein assembly factor BamB family protein n=1 Tax=Oerskovia enterophila TaxID=43678 RepID=UPI00380A850E
MRTMEFEEEQAEGEGAQTEPGSAGTADSTSTIEGTGTARPSGRRLSRRWIAGGAVVAVIAAGLALGGEIEDRRAADRLVAAPGGLSPWFAEPPQELWSLDTPGGRLVSGGAAGLVLLDRETVSRVDLGTGDLEWSREVGTDLECGTDVGWRAAVDQDDPLVCLSGTDDREVTVLDGDGNALGELPLDDFLSTGADVAPGPAGSVVLAERVGEPSDAAPETTVSVQTTNSSEDVVVPVGRGVQVSVVDATTGAVRWEHEVDFVLPGDAVGDCVARFSDEEGVESHTVDVESLTVRYAGGVVQVSGCGVRSLFSADGVQLQAPGDASIGVVPVTSGGFVSIAGDVETTNALDDDGTVRWESPGRYLYPGSTDGSALEVSLLSSDGRLVAVDPRDGRQLWTADIPAEQVLVQAGEQVVVTSYLYRWALDPTTGQTLWETEAGYGDRFSAGSFTDGSRLIEVTMRGDQSTDGTRLTAHELRTGQEAWVVDGLSDLGWFAAIDGALLQVGEGTVTRWG